MKKYLAIGLAFLSVDITECKTIRGGIQSLIKTVVDVKTSDDNAEDYSKDDTFIKGSDGSGFIVGEDGYIVTNCHVISGAKEIKVVLSDDTEYVAQVVGKDERSDIALLKINPDRKLPVVTFANSATVEVADDVFAIGNPLGFGKTVTSGIISFKGRSLSSHMAKGSEGDLVLYLQTDAAVNYGNSGGPLFSSKGEVVGMITVFMGDGGYSTGINFAIPSNIVKKAIDQLRRFGQVRRSWIGIWVELLDHDTANALGVDKIADELNLKNACGCTVKFVVKGSPASSARVQVGDIILSINGQVITEQTNVDYLINNLPIGCTIPMTIMHQNKPLKVSVVVGSKEHDESEEIAYSKIAVLGIGVSDMTDELRMNFNIPQGMKGVLISHLDRDLPLSVGDVILKVGQKEVKSVDDFKSTLDSAQSENSKVALFIYCPQGANSGRTKGEYHYVSIPILKNPSSVLSKIPPKAAKVIPVAPTLGEKEEEKKSTEPEKGRIRLWFDSAVNWVISKFNDKN